MPVLRHREVIARVEETPLATEEKKKKKKKDGKDKEKSGKEKEKKSKKAGGAVVDLLSLDAWTPTAAPAATIPEPVAPKKEKKIGKVAWMPLLTDRGITVCYSIASAGSSTLSICLQVANNNPEGANCSVDAAISSACGIAGAGLTKICTHLAVGSTATATAACSTSGPQVQTSPILLPLTVRVATEGFVGQDLRQVECVMKISLCAGFIPNKLDGEGFAALLGKKTGQWGEAKVRVPVGPGSKAKTVLKNIGYYLRAHVIEEEVTKAASFASKTPAGGGGSVCCLGKCSKDGSYVGVDIKVLCSSTGESQTVAEAIAAALSGLSLA